MNRNWINKIKKGEMKRMIKNFINCTLEDMESIIFLPRKPVLSELEQETFKRHFETRRYV